MPYRKIVVGVDGSETSLEALRAAAKIAKGDDASLVIVSSAERPSERELARLKKRAPEGTAVSPTAAVESALERARKLADDEQVASETASEAGDPAEALIRVAERVGADLIVVGNKGMSGARRFVLSAIPNKVSHHMPCDLLIMKTT